MELTVTPDFAPMDGRCRCDRVRFQVTAPPLITAACHCTGCQRMSASAFSLTALIPTHGFRLTQGEPVIGGLHGAIRHYFCGYCMSWLFTRPEGIDWFVNVRVTLLDDPSPFPPYIETCTGDKLPWATTPARRSFAGFPSLEDLEVLAREYAAFFRQQYPGLGRRDQ